MTLKPCPFCGESPRLFEGGEVHCSNIKCIRPSAWDTGVWNIRPIEDALTAEIERLKRENEELKANGVTVQRLRAIREEWLQEPNHDDEVALLDHLIHNECHYPIADRLSNEELAKEIQKSMIRFGDASKYERILVILNEHR